MRKLSKIATGQRGRKWCRSTIDITGRCPNWTIRVGLTVRRSLPFFPLLADLRRVIRHVSKVPDSEVPSRRKREELNELGPPYAGCNGHFPTSPDHSVRSPQLADSSVLAQVYSDAVGIASPHNIHKPSSRRRHYTKFCNRVAAMIMRADAPTAAAGPVVELQ